MVEFFDYEPEIQPENFKILTIICIIISIVIIIVIIVLIVFLYRRYKNKNSKQSNEKEDIDNNLMKDILKYPEQTTNQQ